ncbi:MAG: hypothetical protein JSV83_00645, partial [Desulfobacterales bacterium]
MSQFSTATHLTFSPPFPKGQDRFLVSQFCDFLDLIGVAEFDGFDESDFMMLGSLGKVTTED